MPESTTVIRTCARPGCGNRFPIAIYSPLEHCSQACASKDKKRDG